MYKDDGTFVPDQCADCVHVKVCQFKEMIGTWENLSPFTFDKVTCSEHEHWGSTSEELNAKPEGKSRGVYEAVISACSTLVEQGYKPYAVSMNKATSQQLVSERLVENVPEAELDSMITPYGNLKVVISEFVPSGQVSITTMRQL